MKGIEVMVAILLLIAFGGGIVTGVVVIVSVASRREDRRYSLTKAAPGPACEATRWLVGARVLGDGFVSSDWSSDEDAARRGPGQEPDE
jgi:hypothetical protein